MFASYYEDDPVQQPSGRLFPVGPGDTVNVTCMCRPQSSQQVLTIQTYTTTVPGVLTNLVSPSVETLLCFQGVSNNPRC